MQWNKRKKCIEINIYFDLSVFGHDYTRRASLMAQWLNNPPAMQDTRVWFLGWEDPLGNEMATHPSILAWRIPWIEEPGGLQSTGSQRVGHDWATSLYYHVMLKFIKKHLGGSIINMFHFYKCNGTFILSCIFQHLGKYSIWFSRMTDILSFNPIAWCQYFHCIFDKKGKILP